MLLAPLHLLRFFRKSLNKWLTPKSTKQDIKFKELTLRQMILTFTILTFLSLLATIFIYKEPFTLGLHLFSYTTFLTVTTLTSLFIGYWVHRGYILAMSRFIVFFCIAGTLCAIYLEQVWSKIAVPGFMIAIIVGALLLSYRTIYFISIISWLSSTALIIYRYNVSNYLHGDPGTYTAAAIISDNAILLCIVTVFMGILKNEFDRRLEATKEQLNMTEKNYKAIVEGQTELIFRFTKDNIITFANEAFCNYFGFKKNTIEGQLFKPQLTEEDRVLLVNYFKQFTPNSPIHSIQHSLILNNGEVRWYDRIDRAIFNKDDNLIEYQTIARDITEQKNIQLELQKNEQKFRNLAETIPALIWILDENNKIIYINKSWNEFTNNLDLDEINKNWQSYFHVDDNKKIKNVFAKSIKTSSPFENDVRLRKFYDGTGTYNWMLMKGVPLFADSQYRGLIVTFIDITQKKKSMIELIRARLNTEKIIKMREEFVANISHEIRTPLNTIAGMVTLLNKTKLSDDQNEYINAINLSTTNLLVIIDDILDFSKVNAGKVKFNYETVNLKKLINEFLKTIKYKVKEKGLEFKLEIDKNVPENVKADPYRINQILLNLISNAIKFTEKGYVKIAIKLLNETKKDYLLEFIIQDTGIGIAKEKIPIIFESFSQESYEISKKYGGTGLGLSITKKLVELQGGELSVESEVDKGSQFKFTLLLKKVEAELDKSENSNINWDRLKGLKVLIVEDNKMNQLVLKRLLEEYDVQVSIANNGKEAVEILPDNKFDIVLMDIRMDTMDGYQATKYIRANINKEIPIIGISANAETDEVDRVKKIGMNDYISKPYTATLLYNTIAKYLPEKSSSKINLNYVKTMAKGDNVFLEEVITQFIQQLEDAYNTLSDAENKKDLDIIYKTLHSIKPSFSYFGATDIYDEIISIENLIKQKEDISKILLKVNQLKNSFPDLIESVKNDPSFII